MRKHWTSESLLDFFSRCCCSFHVLIIDRKNPDTIYESVIQALIWWYFSSDFRNVYEHLKMENYESPGTVGPVQHCNTRDLCVAFDLGFGWYWHTEREKQKKRILLFEPAFRKLQIAYLSESNICRVILVFGTFSNHHFSTHTFKRLGEYDRIGLDRNLFVPKINIWV